MRLPQPGEFWVWYPCKIHKGCDPGETSRLVYVKKGGQIGSMTDEQKKEVVACCLKPDESGAYLF